MKDFERKITSVYNFVYDCIITFDIYPYPWPDFEARCGEVRISPENAEIRRLAPPLRMFAPPLQSHAPPLGKVSMIDQSENLMVA